jgi:hypothetical protein
MGEQKVCIFGLSAKTKDCLFKQGIDARIIPYPLVIYGSRGKTLIFILLHPAAGLEVLEFHYSVSSFGR